MVVVEAAAPQGWEIVLQQTSACGASGKSHAAWSLDGGPSPRVKSSLQGQGSVNLPPDLSSVSWFHLRRCEGSGKSSCRLQEKHGAVLETTRGVAVPCIAKVCQLWMQSNLKVGS